MKFSAYNAGHVLGAAMFLIEIAGVKVRERERKPRESIAESTNMHLLSLNFIKNLVGKI